MLTMFAFIRIRRRYNSSLQWWQSFNVPLVLFFFKFAFWFSSFEYFDQFSRFSHIQNHLNQVQMCAKLLQLCLTLCDPMDYSPPGASVHGILQARILEWVAISFSNARLLEWVATSFSIFLILLRPFQVALVVNTCVPMQKT